MWKLKDEVVQSSVEGVYVEAKRTEKERRSFALSYLISNLFEAKSLDECLDVATKGLSMLDFFQSQISLLEDGYFVVKRNHMDKKYQFLLEKIWGRKFLGHKIDAKTSFVSHLLNSKIVTTADIEDTVKVKLEDFIRDYVHLETGISKSLGMVTRVVSILPKKIDLLMLPLNYRGKIIGSVGFSKPALERQDALFLQNVGELFAQAFEKAQMKEDLRKSEKKYRSLVEGAAVGIITVDPQGTFTFVNESICNMMGYSEKELLGKAFADFIYPDDKKRVLHIFQRFLKAPEGKLSFEFKVIHKKGHVVHLYATPTLFTYKNEVVGSHAIIINITERRKAEEELIRLSSAVKMSNDSIVISNLDGKIIDVNESTLKMYGTDDKRDLIGKNSFDLIVPEERERALEGMTEVLERGYLKNREYHVITKDGNRIPVEMSVAIMKDPDGKPIGLVGISRDISERKRAEEALRRSEEQARRLLEFQNKVIDTAIVIIDIVDKEGNITLWNRAAELITGYSRKEVIGHGKLWEWLYPDPKYRAEIFGGVKKTIETEEIRENFPSTIRCKDGTLKTISWYSNSLQDEKREIIGLIGVGIDITNTERAQEKIRESEEKYRNMVELAPDLIITMDKEGVVISCNSAFEIGSGYSTDEIIGKHFLESPLLQGIDVTYAQKLFNSIIEGELLEPFELTWFNKDGASRISEIRMNLIKKDGEAIGFTAIARDITERKLAEEALQEAKEKWVSLTENTNDIAMIVSSEGIIQYINRTIPPYTPEETIGKTVYEYIPREQHDVMRKSLRKVFKMGEPDSFEITSNIPKIGSIWFSTKAVPIKRDGKVVSTILISADITERKKAEERIRASEERYRNLVELAPDCIMTFDLKGVITSCNTAATEMSGYSKDELVGKHFTKIGPIRIKDIPKYLKMLASTLRGKVPKPFELIYHHKDGTQAFGEVRFSLIKEGDKTVGIQAIMRDITERKKMEKVLERQRNVVVTLSGAKDLNEAINRLFDNLLEIEEFDCAGFYLADEDTGDLDMIIHRGLPAGFVEKVSRLDADSPYTKVVMEGKPIYQKNSDFPPAIREDLQSDGILAVAAIPIQYKGKIIGNFNLASHTHDEISATTCHLLESVGAQIGENIVRARMEEKLRESEEQFRNLYQSIQDPIGIYIGREGHLINYNKAFKRMTGYTDEELKDKIFLDFVHPDDQAMVLEKYRTKYPEEELPLVYEIRAVNKKGETIPIEISVSTYKVKDRVVGIEVIHRDITERKRMEDEIIRYSEHLEELVEERTRELKEAQERLVKSERLAAIGEASTMVGHDLRNPLQSIENATYYLNNELPRLPVSQKLTEMLQVINESVNYADKIVRDLHDFASTKEPILKKTNVNAIVKETLSQVEAPENIKLITELSPLPEIKVDKDLIKRAFLNLAVNGIQAMEKRGTLRVSTKKSKGFVEVSFKDTGIGISKENMEKLFTPFFTTKAKGMGIGLSICNRFIDSHGGSIEVESEEGKGSTFTVKLPVRQNNGGETH